MKSHKSTVGIYRRMVTINYDELTGIIGELEFDTNLLENIMNNGKNEEGESYEQA